MQSTSAYNSISEDLCLPIPERGLEHLASRVKPNDENSPSNQELERRKQVLTSTRENLEEKAGHSKVRRFLNRGLEKIVMRQYRDKPKIEQMQQLEKIRSGKSSCKILTAFRYKSRESLSTRMQNKNNVRKKPK